MRFTLQEASQGLPFTLSSSISAPSSRAPPLFRQIPLKQLYNAEGTDWTEKPAVFRIHQW